MAQIDPALIDLAVSHGYTREKAIAHYSNQQAAPATNAETSPTVAQALAEGQKNIANQPVALEKLKEPDLKGAITQMVPAAVNTGKTMATNMFQGLDTNDESMGALEAASAYGVYKTLKDKITGGNTPPPPPPPLPPPGGSPVGGPPSATPTASAAPATPSTPVQTLQQRLGLVPKVELSPEEKRQERLKTAGTAAEQEMTANAKPISAEGATPLVPAAPAPTDTPPVKVEPPPAAPAPAAPTTTAEVVANPNATPVEKAVTLTQEAPPSGAVQPKPVKGTPEYTNAKRQLIEQQISTFQNRPEQTAAVQKYVAENPLNPHNRDWLHSQFGAETGNVIMQAGLGPNSNTDQVHQAASDYRAGKYPAIPRIDPNATPASELSAAGKPGWAFSNTPQDWISMQRGKTSLGGMASAGLNALGVAGLISDYKDAKKTGDWSNFGLNATGQVLANAVPKAALPAQLATYSKELGESPEELKALGKKLQDAQQASKIGAGRGMQGVPPPNR